MAKRKKNIAAKKTKTKTTRAKATSSKVGTKKATKKAAAAKKPTQKKSTSPSTPKAADRKPPTAVRQALKKGLKLRHAYGGKGLVPTTIAWAKKLADGAPISPQKARKMHAYFARHVVDKRAGWEDPPTPGYVAWLLWGGDAARAWVEKVLKGLDKS